MCPFVSNQDENSSPAVTLTTVCVNKVGARGAYFKLIIMVNSDQMWAASFTARLVSNTNSQSKSSMRTQWQPQVNRRFNSAHLHRCPVGLCSWQNDTQWKQYNPLRIYSTTARTSTQWRLIATPSNLLCCSCSCTLSTPSLVLLVWCCTRVLPGPFDGAARFFSSEDMHD